MRLSGGSLASDGDANGVADEILQHPGEKSGRMPGKSIPAHTGRLGEEVMILGQNIIRNIKFKVLLQ